MKKATVIISLTVLSTPALADLDDDVRCREVGFSRAAEARDDQRFASFIDADARFVSDTVLRGTDAVLEAWSVFLTDGGPDIKWRPQIVEVLDNGRLALTRGPYRVRSTNENGEIREQWGTFNSVWRLNEDGAWRVVFDAGNAAANDPPDSVKALLDLADDCEGT